MPAKCRSQARMMDQEYYGKTNHFKFQVESHDEWSKIDGRRWCGFQAMTIVPDDSFHIKAHS